MTHTDGSNNLPVHYVGIGASAGGLEALEQFFQGIPAQTGLAFIVIQHLSPDYKSMMVEILSKKTDMRVLRAEEGMTVEQDSIYLIPPKKNLSIFHGKLLLSDQSPHERWINLPIDIFFHSLAEDQGENVIAVILSGTGSDGCRGVRAIKEYGGMIMVQDEKDARFDGMPKSAVSTGVADFILRAEEMPEKLLSYVKYPFLTKAENGKKLVQEESGLAAVFSMLRTKTKVDFTYYKPSTIIRRVERRMHVNQVDSLQAYINLLSKSTRELTTLYRDLLIGVTNFFRDKEAFEFLRENILPAMLERKKGEPIRFWVAGCSTGEEAYSLAILLLELMEELELNNKIKIFATDVDNDAILTAGSGLYPESIAADVGPSMLSKYFNRQGEHYSVSRKIRELVVFAQHNLLKDPPFTNIDLVSCRNLLIYLQPVLQKKALEMFNFSLSQHGILFLGVSESTGEMSNYFKARHQKWKIFESKGKRGFYSDTSKPAVQFSPRAPFSRYDTSGPAKNVAESERHVTDRLLKALSKDTIPLTVVINEEMEVIYTVGDTGDYFRLPHGNMANDIRKMVHKEISIPLTVGIQQAFKEEREVTYSNIHFTARDDKQIIQLNIRPLPASRVQPPLLAVLFTQTNIQKSGDTDSSTKNYDYDKETEQRIHDLEQELQFTKENLQATIEELETSNEELQATNEELLASNEELQSTNEELQSVNEELYTVNSEHQHKIIELTELNNDIDNLLTSTEIGTIFLDEKLRLRKFTSHVQEVFNVIESDIGRPMHHLTHHLLDFDLLEAVEEVLETANSSDHKVQSEDGQHFILRIIPYNIAPQTFAGVVITLIDISALVDVETALENSNARLDLAEKIADFASWQWNTSTGVMTFTESLESLFGHKRGRLSHTYQALLNCVHPEDRRAVLEKVSASIEHGEDYEIVHRIVRPDDSERTVKQVGVASVGKNGKTVRLTGIAIDITDEKGNGPKPTPTKRGHYPGIDKQEESLIVIDNCGIIKAASPATEQLFGYAAEELIGQNVSMLMPSPHKEKHDMYIKRYLEDGESRVSETGRKVEALNKKGEAVQVVLSYGKINIGSEILLTGVLTQQKTI